MRMLPLYWASLASLLGTPSALSDSTGHLTEHDNDYVRSSAAASFVEAVERWPASTTETINALLQLYRERVTCAIPLHNKY